MDIKHSYFNDEAEVLAEIEAAGQHPISLDFGAPSNAEHWHDFDAARDLPVSQAPINRARMRVITSPSQSA